MKKVVRRTIILLSTFILCMAMSMTAFAGYDPNVDPRDDVGNYLLDNYTKRDSTVLLFVYAETGDNTVITEQHGFEMSYYGDIADISMFTRGEDPVYGMSFMYRPANAEVYATLDKGEVWLYQFSIENGLYAMGGPTLNSDFVIDSNNYNLQHAENETIRIYTMCGGWSPNNDGSFGSEENIALFCEWAKENEAKLAERTAPQPAEEPTVVETVEESTVEEVEIVEETVEEEPIEVEKEEKVVPVASVDDEPEESGDIIPFVIGGVCFVAFAVIGFLCTRRK